MKTAVIIAAVLLLAVGCKTENSEKNTLVDAPEKAQLNTPESEFGAGVDATTILNTTEMGEAYATLQPQDTLLTSFEAEVTEVCQAKGCWMKLDLGEGRTAMVKFKDYGFFMPKDLAGKKVVVQGKAFVEMMSVEDQKHYAEDAGSSPEEIEAIEAPAKTLGFEASGVRIN